MNSKQQAKKGFKTFLLTLVISLIIFSGIYYLINSQQDESGYYSSGQEELSEYEDVLGSESDVDPGIEEVPVTEKETAAEEEATTEEETTASEDEEEDESVFASLASQEMDREGQRQVLAGVDSGDTTTTTTTTDTATTTTVSESTVPETGVSGPTMGFVMTLIILGFAGYIMFLGPRNVALHNFERDTIEDLD